MEESSILLLLHENVFQGEAYILIIRLGKIAIIFVIILIGLISIGFLTEGLQHSAVDTYEPPGDFVTYEETNIHYIKQGTGDQTVVFDSGNGTSSPYADMYDLQKEVSNDAEAIVYERPGYGWSDATDRPRDMNTMSSEMEKVLDEASDNESFILVGHSMASLEILSYTHRHPKQVDGIVLIDGVHPMYASEMKQSIPMSIHLTKFLKNTGALRLMSHFAFIQDQLVPSDNVSDEVHEEGVALNLDRMWNKTMLAERKAIPENGRQISDKEDIGDTPLVIFSATDNPMKDWKESQETLPELFDDAEQIWIDTDNHFIHHDEPEKIVKEIRTLLDTE